MSKIFWTEAEANLVATRFLQLRLESSAALGGSANELLLKAQALVLPVDRRRRLMGYGAGQLFEAALAAQLTRLQDLLTAPQFPPAVDAASRTPVVEPPRADPAAPFVVEIGRPVPSLHETLANASTGMLFGYAIERWLSGVKPVAGPALTAGPEARGGVLATPTTPKPPIVVHGQHGLSPFPTPPDRPGKVPAPPRHVLVLGLFSGSIDLLRGRVGPFANLRVELVDATRRTDKVRCDYAIIVRGTIPPREADVVKKQFGDEVKDRVRYADTNDGVMRHLAEINSLQ